MSINSQEVIRPLTCPFFRATGKGVQIERSAIRQIAIPSGRGVKVNGLTELPPLLQDEINHYVPTYKNAPEPPFDEEADMTSWVYFQKHFEAYLAGQRFPIPEVDP